MAAQESPEWAATRNHLLSIKEEYFEQDRWYEALRSVRLEHLPFPSVFVAVTQREAEALLLLHAQPAAAPAALATLTSKIAEAQERLQARRVFVKFVRSPKDSGTVYDEAARRLPELLRSRPSSSAWQLFGEARQEGLGVASASDAVQLLASSGRVCAAQGSTAASEGGDLWWSLNGARFGEEFCYERMAPTLMVREFRGALPLQCEWRAFVWDGRCSAVSQYFYDFGFPELQGPEVKERLAADLRACLATLEPLWAQLAARHAMIDFAWQPAERQPVTLIEVNPFDPEKGLGHTSSLALFDWEVDADRQQLMGQGSELEIRVAELQSDEALERAMNRQWSTVGAAAREVLRSSIQELSVEELEASHIVTRAFARKLGTHRAIVAKAKGKGKVDDAPLPHSLSSKDGIKGGSSGKGKSA